MAIRLDLDIWAVISISEVDELFSVKFKVTMTWVDPRLTFLNLKKDITMNIVSPIDAAKMWYPIVVFINTRKMDLSMACIKMYVIRTNQLSHLFTPVQHDHRSTMTIRRNGSFHLSPNEELHNNRLYEGSENPISISRVYSADFECKFSMQFYPFDIQQCYMNFILEVHIFNTIGN